MLEDALKLDYAGIIALEKETELEYIQRGHNILRKADEIKRDGICAFVSNIFDKKIKTMVEFPSAVSRNMAQVFGVNPSWVPVYQMGIQWGYSGYCGEIYSGGIRTPLILYNSHFTKGYSTIQHEAIHAVREFVSYSRFKNFEEAIADYNEIALWPKKFKPSLAIRKARQKLEDKFGDKAGHILIRLTPPEVYAIASSEEPVTHLKEWGCLRHRIIRERLGM